MVIMAFCPRDREVVYLDYHPNAIYHEVLYAAYMWFMWSMQFCCLQYDDSMVATVPVQGLEHTRAISIDSEHNKIYVTKPDADNVSVIDGSTNAVVANIAVGDRPSPLTFNPPINRLYVVNEGSNDVNVIDGFANSLVPVNLIICGASNIIDSNSFMIKCTGAPSDAAELNYSIVTP